METLQVNRKKIEKLSTVLNNSRIKIFEYLVDEDTLVVYNNKFHIEKTIAGYMDYIDNKSKIHPEDREKIKQIYKEAKEATVEIREFGEDGDIKHSVLEFTKIVNEDGKLTLIGSTRDITEQRKQEKKLKERARKDSLTGLYNQVYGKKCINKYLNRKKPFDSCGMIVLDVDCFKLVNDNYGHLFGDKVLARLAMLLKEVFRDNDSILMRAGGDEFVIFVKDILNIELVRKNVELMQKIRELQFGKTGCTITCSAGCCYLPENVSGYTYDQLFENADIALYKAKERGKNCYVYCDSLQHFSSMIAEQEKQEEMLEARYFQNDIVATAFEIFEKTNNFEVAIHLLLKVIGVRLELDRITIVQTDIKAREIYSDYQWNREGIPKVLETVRHFDKEDFLTVFNDFDENGVLVLQHDHMQRYSESATKILIQGEAKTIVSVAMYCEGRYTGAITYAVCKEKRSWSNEMLKQLSEVTKIISAHFAKNQVMNHVYQGAITRMEHDTLTGLISFARFHEEVERIILANKTSDYMMIYMDFENFKYFNYKYGYTLGDQVLKDFCSFIIGKTEEKHNLYFTRVVSDQFLMFRTASHEKDEYQAIIEETEKINEEFIAENLKAGREQVPISINASSLHASDPQTINTYINILKKYSVDPTMVEIELTETAVVSEYESVRKLFDSFQLHGIKTAMDDFGSGYSVLNTIVDIPVDVIKIDRGFITSCLETDRGIYFLKHLIDMIRNLGYQIICEGVETDEQIEILRQIGCDEIQGYWYSKPLKMEDYKELLQTEKISRGGAKHPNRQKILRYTLGNENLKVRKIQ